MLNEYRRVAGATIRAALRREWRYGVRFTLPIDSDFLIYREASSFACEGDIVVDEDYGYGLVVFKQSLLEQLWVFVITYPFRQLRDRFLTWRANRGR